MKTENCTVIDWAGSILRTDKKTNKLKAEEYFIYAWTNFLKHFFTETFN